MIDFRDQIDNPDREAAERDFGCPVRRCSRCREWLPAENEFFPRSSGNRDGLHSWCKACVSDHTVAKYHADKAKREGLTHAVA